MDNELFELCKKVYERFPEWNDTDFGWCEHELDGNIILPYYRDTENYEKWFKAPLYTSDYLLEKLPAKTIHDSSSSTDQDFWLVITPGNDGWYACYTLYAAGDELRHGSKGSTPLKALLKLALALYEAGELNV